MNRSIVMSEPPAPCNFQCEYCYVPPNFHRRRDLKPIKGSDYLRLAAKTGADDYLFWLCAIGEPFMMPNFDDVVLTLTSHHKTCVVTNLSYFGNNIPEHTAKIYPHNLGLYWSVHWNQMEKHGLTNRVLQRAKYLIDCGCKVWPTLVMHPSYLDKLDAILDEIGKLGIRLSLCRYRIGQEDLAALDFERDIEAKYRNDGRISFNIWDITPEAWNVKGGMCYAGTKQVIIDAWWRICSCHGDNNMKVFGKFPEDIDKISLKPNGVCKSSKCPCKHSVFYGVNVKFPHTFADILDDWEGFISDKK